MKKSFNLGCLIRILALVALLAVGFFIFMNCSGSSGLGCQRIDKTLPTISAAPFEIPTKTGTIYAKLAVANNDGSVTVTAWYEKIFNKWKYHPGTDTIPKILNPQIKKRVSSSSK